MKITLHGIRSSYTLDAERVLCNDIRLPGDHNYHHVKLWVIGNEYGPLGAVWASNEGDAIDTLIDSDLAGGILIDESDVENQEEVARGGNAGEPYDSSHLWMESIKFLPDRDLHVMLKFAEAKGANVSNLDQI